MKLIFFIVWLAVVGQFAIWTFAPDKPREAEVNAGDGQPYGYLESHLIESRKGMRESAMATLDLPWSSRCGEARKAFISGVNEYYWQRKNQTERYAEMHGKPGADYIAKAWASPEDGRIDRLTREAYANGYFTPSDFKGYARDLITEVVKDERVTGEGCAG
jgi:hypothetical protein